MIVCPRCAKENQDHYKFCLGCGAELPRDAAHAPKSFTAPTPPAIAAPLPPAPPMGGPPMAAPPMAAPPMAAPPMAAPPMAAPPMAGAGASDQVVCPQCGTSNNRSFKFCGSCGHPIAGSAPAFAPAAAAPPVTGGSRRGSLVLIGADGSEGESFPLGETTVIGREIGGVFASDSYLSPRHATLSFSNVGLTVRDEGSLNGVYLKIGVDQPIELVDRSVFRIGQEIIRFERISAPAAGEVELMGSPSAGIAGRICLITGRTATGNCFCVPSTGLHLGRERGDILFPEDGYVSGLHGRIHEEAGRVFLTDVGSSNGTFIRLMAPTIVPSGGLLLMGQQLFRAEY